MTTAAIANLFNASPTGPGRYQAKCPAHADRTPSLSIRQGDDGRTLIHCHAGCSTEAVLRAGRLLMSDLFPGPPPSPVLLRHAAEERERREAEARRGRIAHGLACDLVRNLEAVLIALGSQLMQSPEHDDLARLYHATCDKLHAAEEREETLRP